MLVDRRRLRSRAEVGEIADLVRHLGEAHDDPRLLDLAASLEHAADSEQPGAAFARAFGLPRYRRSPAKVERDEAYAMLAASPRYGALVGKPRCAKVVEDLTRYAASAAWRADREADECPYVPIDWHHWAWHALMIDPRPPQHWKTVHRAVASRGQNSLVHTAGAESQSTTSPEHSTE